MPSHCIRCHDIISRSKIEIDPQRAEGTPSPEEATSRPRTAKGPWRKRSDPGGRKSHTQSRGEVLLTEKTAFPRMLRSPGSHPNHTRLRYIPSYTSKSC